MARMVARRRPAFLVACTVGLASILDPLGASSTAAPTLAPGDRVRIELPVSERSVRTGIVAGILSDSLLFLEPGADTLAIPSGALGKVEVSRGLEGHSTRYAVWGLFLGAAAGAAIGYAQGETEEVKALFFYSPPVTAGDKAVIGAIIGAGAGVLLGALAGAGHRTEVWEDVPLGQVFGGRIERRFLLGPGSRAEAAVAWSRSF